MRTKEELKTLAIQAIDSRKEKIFEIGDSIYVEPELGFKEFKTSQKIKDVLDSLEIPYEDEIAITGIKANIRSKDAKYKVCVMSELDSVISSDHPQADKDTGAAHSCGHNAMVAAMIGVAYAFSDTDIIDDLAGDVCLMAVPAEEYVEMAYRKHLVADGKVHFLGGKQEFIRLGAFDDVDIAMICHLFSNPDDTLAAASQSSNGFIGQEITYVGKAAHAGASPHLGVNALSAANIGLAAIGANRETFRDEDNIRVHPIITKGGDLVNTIPHEVTLENYIRGNNVDAIIDATDKVTRSWKAGALALGADVIIDTRPGYLPDFPDESLVDLVYDNLVGLYGKDKIKRALPHGTGSSDVGDVSSLLPTIQIPMGGASGGFHSGTYRLVDRDLAYLGAAKTMALTIIDLLYDQAQEAGRITEDFEPVYSKDQYLEEWGNIGDRFK